MGASGGKESTRSINYIKPTHGALNILELTTPTANQMI
jgi:hypothetical protein